MLDWIRLPWGNSDIDELDGLESSLEAAFRPVEPSPEFVHDLRRRLTNFPIPVIPDPDSKIPLYIALAIASLLSGVAIVGFIIWIILLLVGRLQPHEKRVITSPPLAS
jgi:hypothetical protein